MKLIELNPQFLGCGGEGVTVAATGEAVPRREGVALDFDCPCGCGHRVCVSFANPISGGDPAHPTNWQRTGDTFDTLTLMPSILVTTPGGCGWHGYVTNGAIITV